MNGSFLPLVGTGIRAVKLLSFVIVELWTAWHTSRKLHFWKWFSDSVSHLVNCAKSVITLQYILGLLPSVRKRSIRLRTTRQGKKRRRKLGGLTSELCRHGN